MATHGDRLRGAHADQLIGRLRRTREVQMVQEARVVDGGLRRMAPSLHGAFGGGADRDPAGAAARELARLGVGLRDSDVEVLGPVALGIARRLVPIVVDLLVDQHRPLPGHESQERSRRLRQGQPGLEVGLYAEWVGLVVAVYDALVPGEHDGAVEARGPQRVVETLVENGEMSAIFAREAALELLAGGERGVEIRGADRQSRAQSALAAASGVSRPGIIDARRAPPKRPLGPAALDPRGGATETADSDREEPP